jgi:2-dehydropantoate 2-reductase
MLERKAVDTDRRPRFAIIGGGATGGFLGVQLARADYGVTLIARGAHLEAIRRSGLVVNLPDGTSITARPEATDQIEAVADADVVFLTVKAHSISAIAPSLGAALRPGATLVSAQNGIPWWYFHRHGGPLDGTQLTSVDPDGLIARHIDSDQVVGCIVYPSTAVIQPGVIEHIEGTRFSLGEPDRTVDSERCRVIAKALVEAGLEAPTRTDIREELWLKLLGNAALNPISALTRGTLADITSLPETRELAILVMQEVDQVARSLGIDIERGVERRIRGASRVGPHKTSMLQDVEQGRPMEIDALVTAVLELGGLLQLELPHLRTLQACCKLLNLTQTGVAVPVQTT